ncbi:MAG: sensor histidine kinase [Cyclonatronaceae bacterium]
MKNLFPFYNRLSISKKLALWYGFSLFIMLSLFGFFLHKTFQQSIQNSYDRHLRFEAEQLLPFIQTNDTLAIDLTGYGRMEALRSGTEFGTYVRLYGQDHRKVYQSPNYSGTDEPPDSQIPDAPTLYSYSSEWKSLPARTLYLPIEDNSNELIGWLEVTGFEWMLYEETTRFRRYILLLIAISVAFSILGGYLLSKKALSPVASITRTAKSITAMDLEERIPVNYQVRDELTDLAETFNTMLNRLEKGFEREKRFTSDASHELMTPLSLLRTEAEVMLRRPRSKEEYRETIERMLVEVRRMSEMVHLLLQLSRVESVHRSRPEVINISRISEVLGAIFKEAAHEKEIVIKEHIESELYINAHEAYIEEVINNLLENALKYTPAGGTVSLELKRSGSKAVLHLSDTGIGFDGDTRDHLFERFYRTTQQEVQDQPGSGLGLPLVKAIIELYRGKIRAYSDGPGKGSTFVVELPLAKEQ